MENWWKTRKSCCQSIWNGRLVFPKIPSLLTQFCSFWSRGAFLYWRCKFSAYIHFWLVVWISIFEMPWANVVMVFNSYSLIPRLRFTNTWSHIVHAFQDQKEYGDTSSLVASCSCFHTQYLLLFPHTIHASYKQKQLPVIIRASLGRRKWRRKLKKAYYCGHTHTHFCYYVPQKLASMQFAS